jgi:hypothetical protein
MRAAQTCAALFFAGCCGKFNSPEAKNFDAESLREVCNFSQGTVPNSVTN